MNPKLVGLFKFAEVDWVLGLHGRQEETGLSDKFSAIEFQVNQFEVAPMEVMRNPLNPVVHGVATAGVVADSLDGESADISETKPDSTATSSKLASAGPMPWVGEDVFAKSVFLAMPLPTIVRALDVNE